MLSCTYETVKYVYIKDARLGILRTCLLLAIVLYVSVFELWAQGGWLASTPVVGVVRFSLQQPTVGDCDPTLPGCENAFAPLTELPYCEQESAIRSNNKNKKMDYPGNVYACDFYEATNAQILSEKSIAIITRASTRQQELVCKETDIVCKRTYNDTSPEHKFYTAQSEAFTVLVDHAVTASKICARRRNYACSSESSQYRGRLLSKNAALCRQEHIARGNAFVDYRGTTRTATAPCYITPNATINGQDFFSLDVLLQAANDISLDDCSNSSPGLSRNESSKCQTYRETGGTILLNIYWSDFQSYRGVVEPYYYYAPHVLPGSAFKQNMPYYESYRTSRTLLRVHGFRIAALLGGDYHEFDGITFLVTLTTAVGLLAVTTTLVDALMLYVLPEKERYQRAKYEQEGGGGEDDMLEQDENEQHQEETQVLAPVSEAAEEVDELNEPLL